MNRAPTDFRIVGAQFIAPDPPPGTPIFNPNTHHRRSIRLRSYDYSQAGAYFITVCTQKRECLFGDVLGDVLQLNEVGRMVQNVWDALPDYYAGVALDAFYAKSHSWHCYVERRRGAIHCAQ